MNDRPARFAGDVAKARGDGKDKARAARLRRSAWLLGLLAIGFYLGFIFWNLTRAPIGG